MILKGKTQPVNPVEQYLANRDWTVISATTLKAALSSIVKERPDFIFLAADHPNKKVKILPNLIAQAFGIRTIGFIESTTTLAMQSLNELKLEYVLLPPVSGPAIERLVARIKKDEQRAIDFANRETESKKSSAPPEDQTAPAAAATGKVKKPGMMIFSSEKSEGPNGYRPTHGEGRSSNQKESTSTAKKLLEQLLSEEAKTDSSDSMGAVQVKKGSHHNEVATSDPDQDLYQADWKTAEEKPQRGIEGDEDPESFDETYDPEGVKKVRKSNLTGGSKSKGGIAYNPVPSAGQREDHGPQYHEEDEAPDQPNPMTDQKKVSGWRPPSPLADSDSILVKGTQEAIDNSVQKIEGLAEYESLGRASNVACIVVESAKFSGYLVAAMGKDRLIDEFFIETVKQRLVEFLKKHGETIKEDEDGLSLKLEQIDFEDWALDQAEFLRKSIHGKAEIAMAFFPNADTQVRLEQSVNENMLQMDIGELESDVPVDFDMYIYMPTNNRYLLYTPQGRKLGKDQHGRLKDRGINKVHLRKESQGQVKKYRAQVFLNSKIQAYKSSKKTKAS